MKDAPKRKNTPKWFKIIGVIMCVCILLVVKGKVCDFFGFQTANNKLKYEKCLQQDISVVYQKLAYNHNVDVEEIQKFIPNIILKDFMNCACNSYVYGNPFVSQNRKNINCQKQVISKNIVSLTSGCVQKMKNTVFNEYKKQHVKFDEQEWNIKYKESVNKYCVCLVSAKESALTAVEHNLLSDTDVVKSIEEQDLKCVQNHLRDFL